MRVGSTISLALSALACSVVPSAAAFWDCTVPEMDGPSGISAIALLVSVGMIAYQKRCSK
jgi:hypothetical protein